MACLSHPTSERQFSIQLKFHSDPGRYAGCAQVALHNRQSLPKLANCRIVRGARGMSRFNFGALLRALPVLPNLPAASAMPLTKSPAAKDAALLEANRLRCERLNKLVRQQPVAALGVLSYWLHSRS